ncbi:MAG: hypothetical protein V3U83_01970, partial [Acidobacteriota bacterium]
MAPRISIVQLGKGTVGAALIDQIAAQREALKSDHGIDLVCAGIAGRARSAFRMGGLDLTRWREAVDEGPALDGGA